MNCKKCCYHYTLINRFCQGLPENSQKSDIVFLIDGISYEITGTPTVGNPVFSMQKDTKTALFSLSDDTNGEAELRITTDDGESVYRSPMKNFRFLSNYLKTN